MSIKLVICDIGNTIYKEEKSNKFDKIQQITHGDFAEIVNKSDDNLFDLTNKYLKSLNINNEKIFFELYEYFKTLKNRSTPAQLTNENIFEVAKFIKSKNIKLILSSNSNILTKKNDDKLLPFVDGIERTYKIGFLKDEPEYYDRCTAFLGDGISCGRFSSDRGESSGKSDGTGHPVKPHEALLYGFSGRTAFG